MNRGGFDVDDFGYSDNPDYLDHCLNLAVQKLRRDGKVATARLLISCSRTSIREDGREDDKKHVSLTLHAPMLIVEDISKMSQHIVDGEEILSWEEYIERQENDPEFYSEEGAVEFIDYYPILDDIRLAFSFAFGQHIVIRSINVLTEQTVHSDWRNEEWEFLKSGDVQNQGPMRNKGHEYVGLRFASKTEIRIAEALELENVMYFPLCTCRVNDEQRRVTRQPDFLIFHKGKWGILEADGPHHEGRAAKDHDRDRLFRLQGKIVIEHFTDDDCYNHPRETVRKFLKLLETQV